MKKLNNIISEEVHRVIEQQIGLNNLKKLNERNFVDDFLFNNKGNVNFYNAVEKLKAKDMNKRYLLKLAKKFDVDPKDALRFVKEMWITKLEAVKSNNSNLNEADVFKAKSKKTGRTVVYKSKDALKNAIKSGAAEPLDKEKSKDKEKSAISFDRKPDMDKVFQKGRREKRTTDTPLRQAPKSIPLKKGLPSDLKQSMAKISSQGDLEKIFPNAELISDTKETHQFFKLGMESEGRGGKKYPIYAKAYINRDTGEIKMSHVYSGKQRDFGGGFTQGYDNIHGRGAESVLDEVYVYKKLTEAQGKLSDKDLKVISKLVKDPNVKLSSIEKSVLKRLIGEGKLTEAKLKKGDLVGVDDEIGVVNKVKGRVAYIKFKSNPGSLHPIEALRAKYKGKFKGKDIYIAEGYKQIGTIKPAKPHRSAADTEYGVEYLDSKGKPKKKGEPIIKLFKTKSQAVQYAKKGNKIDKVGGTYKVAMVTPSGYYQLIESTKSYEKALLKIVKDKQLKGLTKDDKEKLLKIAQLLKTANENKLTEGRMKKVTKSMWKKMKEDARVNALLSAFKDPDDAEEHWEKDWDDLPSQASHMYLYESKLNEASVPAKFSDAVFKVPPSKMNRDWVLKVAKKFNVDPKLAIQHVNQVGRLKLKEGELTEEDYKYKKYVKKAFNDINGALFNFRHSMGLKQITNDNKKLKKKVDAIHQSLFDLEREFKKMGLTEGKLTEATAASKFYDQYDKYSKAMDEMEKIIRKHTSGKSFTAFQKAGQALEKVMDRMKIVEGKLTEAKKIKPHDLGYRIPNIKRAISHFKQGDSIAASSKSGKGTFRIDKEGDFKKYPTNDWEFAYIKEGKLNENYNLGLEKTYDYEKELGKAVSKLKGIDAYNKAMNKGGRTAVSDTTFNITISQYGTNDNTSKLKSALKKADPNLDVSKIKNNLKANPKARSKHDQDNDIWKYTVPKTVDYHKAKKAGNVKTTPITKMNHEVVMSLMDMMASYTSKATPMANTAWRSLKDFMQTASDYITGSAWKQFEKDVKKTYPKLK